MNYLRYMAVFAKVAESGSTSAAANELSLPQTVIAQELQSLEEELGVVLLQRSTARQTLTPAGMAFYEKCQQMNQLAQDAWEGARESQLTPTGAVTITAPHTLMDNIVAPAIGELVSVYPAIVPHLVADDALIDVGEQETDCAVVVGETPGGSHHQRRIGQFRDILCGSPEYLDQLGESLEYSQALPERLQNCDYVANVWQGKHVIHHLFHPSQSDPLTLVLHPTRFADSLPASLALIEAGVGLGLIPEFVFARQQDIGTLEEVVPGSYLAPKPVYAVHGFNTSIPLLVRLCIEAVEARLSAPS